jgi:hypothetical protein
MAGPSDARGAEVAGMLQVRRNDKPANPQRTGEFGAD